VATPAQTLELHPGAAARIASAVKLIISASRHPRHREPPSAPLWLTVTQRSTMHPFNFATLEQVPGNQEYVAVTIGIGMVNPRGCGRASSRLGST